MSQSRWILPAVMTLAILVAVFIVTGCDGSQDSGNDNNKHGNHGNHLNHRN